MKSEFQIRIFDNNTGAVLPLNKRPSDMKEYISHLEPKQRLDLFSKVNYIRKQVAAAEKAIKDYVKSQDLDFDEDGLAIFEGFKIKNYMRYSFDKERFEEEASEEEKLIVNKYQEIMNKYQKANPVFRI